MTKHICYQALVFTLLLLLTFQGHAQTKTEADYLSELEAAQAQNDPLALYKAGLGLGIYYQQQGRFEEAEKVMLDAVSPTGQLEKKIYLADLYTNLGLNHYYQGEYEQATEYHLKNLEISEAVDYTLGKIKGTNNLGIIALRTGDLDEALKQHQLSLAISEEAQHQGGIAYNLGNLALIYTERKEFPKALEMRRRSLHLFQKDSNQLEITRCLNNMGVSYQAMGIYDSAGYYYRAALERYQQAEDKHGISESLPNVAFVLRQQGRYAQAEPYLTQALGLAEETGSKEAKQYIYRDLSDLYQDWGRYQLALENRKLYENWKDSVVGENHLQAIEELQVKYDTERKERELLALEQENLVQSEAIAKRNLGLVLLGLVSMLALGAGVAVWVISLQRIRFAKEKAAFEAVIATEETERKRIAQDLHDSIGSMLSVVKGQMMELAEGEQKLNLILPLVADACDEVRRISHDLSPQILESYGLEVAIGNLVENVNASRELGIQYFPYGLENALSPMQEVLIYRMVQELIQNALKHAGARNMEIHLTRHPRSLNLLVEDDGKGFAEEELQSADGIGLANIRSRVAQLSGTFERQNKAKGGMSVLIEIPL